MAVMAWHPARALLAIGPEAHGDDHLALRHRLQVLGLLHPPVHAAASLVPPLAAEELVGRDGRDHDDVLQGMRRRGRGAHAHV